MTPFQELLEKMNLLDDRAARLFTCDCAERVLPIFEKEYPDDDRPRKAIAVARLYADGKATQEELDAACDAAWAAACAATCHSAWAAARAAALNTAWTAARDAACDAAWGAVWDAARAAAWDAECAWQADHLRSIYTPNPLEGE